MTDIIFLIISNVLTFLGSGGLFWFLTMRYQRRKLKADAAGSELDNIQTAVSIWRELSQQLEVRIKDLEEKVRYFEQRTCYNETCENRRNSINS